MQYVFAAFIYDLHAILVHAMPSKTNSAMIAAFTNILANLNAHRYSLMLNIMDNECSMAVKAHIQSNQIYTHLVPPTITESMLPDARLLHSRSILSLPLALSTETARYNLGMISFPRWN